MSTEEKDKDKNKTNEEIAVAAAPAMPAPQPKAEKDKLPELSTDDDDKDKKDTKKIEDHREFLTNSSSIAEALKSALLNMLSPRHGMAFGEGFAFKLLVKPLLGKALGIIKDQVPKAVTALKNTALKLNTMVMPSFDKAAGNEELAKRAQKNAQMDSPHKQSVTISPFQAVKLENLNQKYHALQHTPANQIVLSKLPRALPMLPASQAQKTKAERLRIEQKLAAMAQKTKQDLSRDPELIKPSNSFKNN